MTITRSTNECKSELIEIKEDEPNKTAIYLQRKRDLERCITIIKTQLLKKKTPKYLVRTGLISTLIGASYDLVSKGLTAAAKLSQFLNAGPVVSVGMDDYSGFKTIDGNFIKNITVNCGEFYKINSPNSKLDRLSGFAIDCNSEVSLIQDYSLYPRNYACDPYAKAAKFPLNLFSQMCDSYEFCQSKMNELCVDNPWTELWYPNVIVIGIGLAGFLLLAECCINMTGIFVEGSRLTRLSEQDLQIIQSIANKYQIPFRLGDSLEDTLTAFQCELGKLKESHRYYLCRHATIVGGRLTSTSSLNLLFSHAQAEPKLFPEIFEFAGLDEDSIKRRPARKAMMDATSQSNRDIALHRFFNTLSSNQVNQNEELVYDKEEVVGKIFAYAGISKNFHA